MVLPTLLILAVYRMCVTTKQVNMTSLTMSLQVAQWLECPTGVHSGGQGFETSLSHVHDKTDYSIFLNFTLV